MVLDEVTDELYGLPLGEFVATRAARAKQARAGGDRDLAAAILALAKPTKVAWLVNRLVRERPEEIEPLMALGAGLREATAALSGDDLRRLSRQQHQLVQAMVGHARAIANAAGVQVSPVVADGVEQTLRAGLADGTLAAAVSAGRLTERLTFAGFGGGPVNGAGAADRHPAAPVAKVRQPEAGGAAAVRQQRLERADRAAVEARAALAEAQALREAAQTGDDAAVAAAASVAERIAELRDELEQVSERQRAADQDALAARAALEAADRGVRTALRRLDAARTERARLTGE